MIRRELKGEIMNWSEVYKNFVNMLKEQLITVETISIYV